MHSCHLCAKWEFAIALTLVRNNYFILSALLHQKIRLLVMLHLFPNVFYALLLIEGLNLDQNITSTNKTYFQVNKPNNQVISDHTTFPKKKLVLEVDEENKKPS